MPVYYFDTSAGRSLVADEDGIALPDDETARRHSLRGLVDMAHDKANLRDREDFMVRVRDEAGREVYKARLTLEGRWVGSGLHPHPSAMASASTKAEAELAPILG